jgi:hypothetical protein
VGRKRGDPKKADQSLPPAPTADRARDGAEVARSSDAPRDANVIKARQIVIRRERAEPRVSGGDRPAYRPPALAFRARPHPPAERASALPKQACHRARQGPGAPHRRRCRGQRRHAGILAHTRTRQPGGLVPCPLRSEPPGPLDQGEVPLPAPAVLEPRQCSPASGGRHRLLTLRFPGCPATAPAPLLECSENSGDGKRATC